MFVHRVKNFNLMNVISTLKLQNFNAISVQIKKIPQRLHVKPMFPYFILTTINQNIY